MSYALSTPHGYRMRQYASGEIDRTYSKLQRARDEKGAVFV
jgi:hypothetical protein